jgi:hypothetical protein
MADGAQPVRRRGKRRSQVADQCQWAMREEVRTGLITKPGFVLLPTAQVITRVKARLTGAGFPKDDLPENREIRRWQLRSIKALDDEI